MYEFRVGQRVCGADFEWGQLKGIEIEATILEISDDEENVHVIITKYPEANVINHEYHLRAKHFVPWLNSIKNRIKWP